MKQRRNTVAKTEILNLLSHSKPALSHAEIQMLLNGVCDRVTIYRVLERLTEEGLIHKVATIEGVVKYAECHTCSATEHHHDHIHFSCEQCHKVTCIEDVKPSFSLPESYKVHNVNFTISGICPQCC